MRTNRLKVAYVVVTALFGLPQAWSAVQYLTEAPRMMATIAHLGYPTYFVKELAIAKLLALVAIAVGRSRTLKEWAYAGLTFDVLGAFFSHVAVGDPAWVMAVPLVFLALQFASYVIWRALHPALSSTSVPNRGAGEPISAVGA